jgi:hypothetical protein
MNRNHNFVGQEKKIQVRVMSKIAIYSCINNSYGLNKYTRVEKVLETCYIVVVPGFNSIINSMSRSGGIPDNSLGKTLGNSLTTGISDP